MIPIALQQYNQWILWRAELIPGRGDKPQKIPYSATTGKRASTVDPSTWCDYATACAALASGGYNGLAFVFSSDDPFTFIDLDGCRDAVTGEWTPDALEIASMFQGAAMEISQSGTGLHIVCSATGEYGDRLNRWNGWIERYTVGRFMALGGGDWTGDPTIDYTSILDMWLPYRPRGASVGDDIDAVISIGRDPRWNGPDDDVELLRRMMIRREPDYDLIAKLGEQLQQNPNDALLKYRYERATYETCPFEWLWTADPRLAQYFPLYGGVVRADGVQFDWSSADQALMNRLSFWTGRDWVRMQRLFSQSALANRPKWRDRSYYRNVTTGNGIRWPKEVYSGTKADKRDEAKRRQTIEENIEIGDEFTREQHQIPIMSLEEMRDDFFYIHSINFIASMSTKRTFKVDNSDKTFASSVTARDTGKRDPTTGDPVIAYVKTIKLWLDDADGCPKMVTDRLTWKPNGPIVCDVPESFDRGFNMWRGFVSPKWYEYYRDNEATRNEAIQGWNYHLSYLIPDAGERHRFEQWCAHMMQKPQELPHTAYLMFTEETGVGRNWLSSVLVRVLRGYVAAGIDIQEVLDGSFNGRLSQKLLAVVDEAKAGMQDGKRYARSERLKSLVNQASREINVKHGLQSVEHNCMRWLFFSNHADALPFDNNDRRIVVIENPSQRQSTDYYKWLYSLIDDDAFIGAVYAHLMHGVSLEGFNPGEHAPLNAAKQRALGSMQSETEKAVAAFARECPGDIATIKQLREFIDRYASDNSGTKAPSPALRRWIEKSGMTSADHTIRINGAVTRIIILRNFTQTDVKNMEAEKIRQMVVGNDIWLKMDQNA